MMYEIGLCKYAYDPLDRLVKISPLANSDSQRFYCKNRLTTEIQSHVHHSIFQYDNQLLAQQQSGRTMSDTTLLATDQQRSVLNALASQPTSHFAYSPYGHRTASSASLSLIAFVGEWRDPLTGYYLLGNGYRAFNSVLMRFNNPDRLSPFEKGGLNPYTYCLGDPVNRTDPTGRSSELVRLLELYRPPSRIPRPSLIGAKTNMQKANSDGLHLAGFHGTSSKNIDSLQKGLSLDHAGTANGQTEGVGFYATPDFDYAQHFAREAILLENPKLNSKTIFPYINFSRDAVVKSTSPAPISNTPVVMGVYVKNYPSRMAGRDFKFVRGDENPIKSSEIIFPASMYKDIVIRPLPSNTEVPTPWIQSLNIRHG